MIEGGGWGNQTINGGVGNDTIYADKGNDVVGGGAGDDTFRVSGNQCANFEGWDKYDGGEGNDRIVAFGSNVDVGLTGFSAANGIETIDFSGLTGQGACSATGRRIRSISAPRPSSAMSSSMPAVVTIR